MATHPAPTARTSASTVLRVDGGDALALLHRISTNFLADLGPGHVRATLFCDFRGRLLHRAVVCATSDGTLWLIRDDASGAPLAAYLDRHVFREQVRIADLSAAWTVDLGAPVPDMRPGTTTERGAVPDTVQLEGLAWLVRPAAETVAGDTDRRLEEQRARIEAGRPAHGHEIAEEFNPFEVGLDGEVHLDKGCFTGQEALLRMVTYRSIRRRLARVEGRGWPARVPCDIRRAGQTVGRLTSVAPETREPNRWIGLAVLKKEAVDDLQIDGAESVETARFFPTRPPLGWQRGDDGVQR
jgi:folate-binding protein YgfZ